MLGLSCLLSASETDPLAQATILLETSQVDTESRALLRREARALIDAGLLSSDQAPVRLSAWLRLLWLYHFLDEDYASSIAVLERALMQLETVGNPVEDTAETLSHLSYSLILTGQIAAAQRHLRKAVVLLRATGSQQQLADVYYSLADAYQKNGERRVARRYFAASLELGQSDAHRMTTYLKLGAIAREDGRVDEAIALHEAALSFFAGIGRYREIVAEIELARDFLAIGDLTQATRHATSAASNPIAMAEQALDANIVLLQTLNQHRFRDGLTELDRDDARAIIRRTETLLDEAIRTQGNALARPVRQVQFAAAAVEFFSAEGDIAQVRSLGERASSLILQVADDLQRNHGDHQAWLARAQPMLATYVRSLYRYDRAALPQVLEQLYSDRLASQPLRTAGLVNAAYENEEIARFEAFLAAEAQLVDSVDAGATTPPGSADTSDRLALLRRRDAARDAYLAERVPAATDLVPDLRRQDLTAQLQRRRPGDLYLRFFVQEDVSFAGAVGQRRAAVARTAAADRGACVDRRHTLGATGGARRSRFPARTPDGAGWFIAACGDPSSRGDLQADYCAG